jgi:hypothetical protein
MKVSPAGVMSSNQVSSATLAQNRSDAEIFAPQTLWQEAKEFSAKSPVLSVGFIASISSFLAGLTTKTTIQYLPLTFVPALMAFAYEFFFPSNQAQSIEPIQGEGQVVGGLPVNQEFEKKDAA